MIWHTKIQQDVHNDLIRKKGSYIFVNKDGFHKRLSAELVSQKLKKGKWFKDRSYPHKFLKAKQVF